MCVCVCVCVCVELAGRGAQRLYFNVRVDAHKDCILMYGWTLTKSMCVCISQRSVLAALSRERERERWPHYLVRVFRSSNSQCLGTSAEEGH